MRQLTVEETKKIAVDILEVVARFCEGRGIKYWLDYGTLLGAVRHKGFIPWDDDIDIGMLRPDYDRFMKEFNGYNSRYEFRCIENNPDFVRGFGRVFDTCTLTIWENMENIRYGVDIDIFVHDNAPDDDKAAEKMYRCRDFYNKMNFLRLTDIFSNAGGNILRRLCVYAFRTIIRIFPIGYFPRKLAENSKRYSHEDTRRIGEFVEYYYSLVSREAVSSFVDLEFEGKKYKAPIGYDELLTQYYGDYMTPPPPEQRVRHHLFTGYMKDEDK